jgi:alkylation response protein AidB-like acyl-CoA dehydrogenase
MEKLVLTEEEQMVRESAADFLAEQAGPDELRAIRDNENPLGYSAETWQQMIELGWPAILVAEEQGGLGFSHTAMGQIMELAGNTLACSPLFATAVAGASVLSLGGTDAQIRWLARRCLPRPSLVHRYCRSAGPTRKNPSYCPWSQPAN